MITIYIGNLPVEVTENALRKIFEKFGKVNKVNVAADSFSKNKLGFGFVEMPGGNQAKEAVETLNHAKIKDRTVMVCETKSRNDRRKAAVEHKEVTHV